MIPEFAYFLKVNMALVLLYAFYRLFFYKDTFFKLRRTILLVFFGVSVIYPFLDIQDWIREQEPMTEVIQMYSAILPEVTPVSESSATGVNWQELFLSGISYLYWGGVFILLLRFFVQLGSILWLAYKSEVAYVRNVRVHLLSDPAGPFSFFRLVFLHVESHSEKEIDEILTHECTHVNQWHSIDVMLSELVCIACWVNPFAWLLKREVRHNLEYLADDKVLKSGYDSRSYQYHLLGLAHTDKSIAALSNNFNMLHLKNRILMMNKKRTRGIGRTKYLVFIPIVAFLLLFSNIDTLARFTNQWVEEVLTETVHSSNELIDENVKKLMQFFPAENNASSRKEYVTPNLVYTVVQKMPKFPGGMGALMSYLAENVKYPEAAFEKGIQGRVSCSFIVNKDGSITDAEILRGVSPEIDAEAIRVIKSMPKWEPGRQRGKVVDVKYTVPISFRLPKEKQKKVITQYVKEPETIKKIFTVVEEMPEFPGGTRALMKYIANNIKYPVSAHKNGIQGRITCSFVVGVDGSVQDIQIKRGVDPALDAEAVRVVSSMPKWEPGRQRGVAVPVRYTIPINFRLG